MDNLVTQARLLGQLTVLAALLLGPPNLCAADSDGKLVASSSPLRGKALSAHATAQHSAAKQNATATPPVTGRQPLSTGATWCQINGDRVNVRTGPGTQYQILAALHGGDYVKGRAVQDGWLEVDWPHNIPVWIGKEFVQASTDAGGVSSATTTKSARVYSAGQVRSTVVAKLDPGAHLAVVGEEGNWYKIEAPESAAAYVSAKYALPGVAPPAPPPSRAPVSVVTQTPVQAPPPPVSTAAASAPAPASTQVLPPNRLGQAKEDLLAAIEQTRKDLMASAPATVVPSATEIGPTETARVAADAKNEADELPAARIAIEGEAKAAAEEQAKREAETKRLQEVEAARVAEETRKKVAVEEQAMREAETKRLQVIEAAREAEETRKRAATEEQARREAETKRLQEIETARAAEETRKKAEAEEQARHDTEAKMRAAAEEQAQREAFSLAEAEQGKQRAGHFLPAASPAQESSPREGAFFDPLQPAPMPTSSFGSRIEDSEGAPNASQRANSNPQSAIATAPALPTTGELPSVQPPMDDKDAATLSTLPQALKRIHAKFIVPSQAPSESRAPARTGPRAQVVKVDEEDNQTAGPATDTERFLEPAAVAPERPRQVLKIAAPSQEAGPRVPELPTPAGEPPPSLRLKPFFETQVRGTESGANIVTAEGVIERRTPSPVAGVEYALVQDGRTLHFLTAHAEVNLEGLVGRRVSVTGVPVPCTASEANVLEVGTVSSNE